MTLQQAIEANTAALQALTAALAAGGYITPVRVQETAVSTQRGQVPKVDTAEPAKADPLPPLDYERDVKPLVLKLAAVNKPAVLKILEGWQVKKGSEVQPDNLPEFKLQLEKALA